MRPYRSTVALGMLAAGLVLTQQACTSTGRDLRRPVAFSAPDPFLSGAHQLTIRPLPAPGSIVAVADNGPLTVSGSRVFVFSAVGDKYMVKSVEGSCWSVGEERRVVAAACDASAAGQLFTITPHGPSAYAISNQGAFLQAGPGGGLTAEGALATTYAFTAG